MRAIFFDFTGAAVLVKARSLVNHRRLASFPRLIRRWINWVIKRLSVYMRLISLFVISPGDQRRLSSKNKARTGRSLDNILYATLFLVPPVYLEELCTKLNCEDSHTRPLRRALGFMDILNKVIQNSKLCLTVCFYHSLFGLQDLIPILINSKDQPSVFRSTIK